MIALALRFDLYLYYLRKQTKATNDQTLQTRLEPAQLPVPDKRIIKAPYTDVAGQWGEWFWTLGAPKQYRPNTFPKVYFTASLVGYVLGLLMTLLVLNIFNHAQPALLYLVPGVLIALWATALVRGELGLMLSYSEAAQGDSSDTSTAIDAKKPDGHSKSLVAGKVGKVGNSDAKGTTSMQKSEREDHAHHIFLFSLTTPRNLHGREN